MKAIVMGSRGSANGDECDASKWHVRAILQLKRGVRRRLKRAFWKRQRVAVRRYQVLNLRRSARMRAPIWRREAKRAGLPISVIWNFEAFPAVHLHYGNRSGPPAR